MVCRKKVCLKGCASRCVPNPASPHLLGVGWLGILVCSYRGLVACITRGSSV